MTSLNIYKSGQWKQAKEVYVLRNGQWVAASDVYVKYGDVWRHAFAQTVTDVSPEVPDLPPTGTGDTNPYAGQKTFDVRTYGARTSRSDNVAYFQDALDAAAAYSNSSRRAVVLVPKGTWNLRTSDAHRNNTLRISSYVTFYCQDGARLNFTPNYERDGGTGNCHLIASDPETTTMGGYDGPQSVIIDGGIWDANLKVKGMAFAHCSGLTIKNLTILDCYGNGHGIEINGSEYVTVDNVTLKGVRDAGGGMAERDFDEAIQFDFGWDGATIYNKADGTACRHITVKNCYVGDSSTPGAVAWPRAIGTHNTGTNANRHRYFDISNNTIVGCRATGGGAIRIFNMRDVLVYGNSLTKCLRPINGYIRESNQASSDITALENIVIKGNVIDNCGSSTSSNDAIEINVKSGIDAKWYNVDILNNSVTNFYGTKGAFAVAITDAKDVSIKNNYLPNRLTGTDKANMIKGRDASISGSWVVSGNTPDNT